MCVPASQLLSLQFKLPAAPGLAVLWLLSSTPKATSEWELLTLGELSSLGFRIFCPTYSSRENYPENNLPMKWLQNVHPFELTFPLLHMKDDPEEHGVDRAKGIMEWFSKWEKNCKISADWLMVGGSAIRAAYLCGEGKDKKRKWARKKIRKSL